MGNEFRIEVENKISDKEEIKDLNRIIDDLEGTIGNLEDDLEISDNHSDELQRLLNNIELN